MFYLSKQSCKLWEKKWIIIYRLLLSALPCIYVIKLSHIQLFWSPWNDFILKNHTFNRSFSLLPPPPFPRPSFSFLTPVSFVVDQCRIFSLDFHLFSYRLIVEIWLLWIYPTKFLSNFHKYLFVELNVYLKNE